jgi:hypothetical protein
VASVDPQQVEDIILGFTLAEHDQLRGVLMEVFERMPQEDLEVLIEERRIRFILAAWNQAIHFPVPQAGDYYLLVIQSNFCDWPHSNQIYTVAHELAHAFLEHKATSVKIEFLADKQVVRWGFKEELKAVPNSYLRGTGMETVFGITIAGIEKKGG